MEGGEHDCWRFLEDPAWVGEAERARLCDSHSLLRAHLEGKRGADNLWTVWTVLRIWGGLNADGGW